MLISVNIWKYILSSLSESSLLLILPFCRFFSSLILTCDSATRIVYISSVYLFIALGLGPPRPAFCRSFSWVLFKRLAFSLKRF